MQKYQWLSVCLLLLMLLIVITTQSQWLLNNDIQQQLHNLIPTGPSGYITLVLCLALLTSIGLPRQIAAFSCGYSMGYIMGALFATLATTLGCYLTYLFAKKYLSHWAQKKFPQRCLQINHFFSQQLIYKAFIIRILPLGSNFLTNVIAGSCHINAKPYVFGSCLGFIPQMVIFSMAGAGIKVADNSKILLSVLLFVLALIISSLLYFQQRKNLKTLS